MDERRLIEDYLPIEAISAEATTQFLMPSRPSICRLSRRAFMAAKTKANLTSRSLLSGVALSIRWMAELNTLQAEVDAMKRRQTETAAELDALLPSILDKAFKGEL